MLRWATCRANRFRRDARGAVTVEFVVSLPVLVAVLAFATQYGRAMQVRNSLDVAVRDAARYLSRAPMDAATGTIDPTFFTNAQTLVNTRIGPQTEAVRFTVLTADATGAEVTVEADVDFPFLTWLDRTGQDFSSFTMTATDEWPRTE